MGRRGSRRWADVVEEMRVHPHLREFGIARRPEEWIWCLHCERVFQAWEVRVDRAGLVECAYEDCDGSLFDFSNYEAMRTGRGSGWGEPFPWFPEKPEKGVRYPLYPESNAAGQGRAKPGAEGANP